MNGKKESKESMLSACHEDDDDDNDEVKNCRLWSLVLKFHSFLLKISNLSVYKIATVRLSECSYDVKESWKISIIYQQVNETRCSDTMIIILSFYLKTFQISDQLHLERQVSKVNKVDKRSRGWPEGSLFDSYYTKV